MPGRKPEPPRPGDRREAEGEKTPELVFPVACNLRIITESSAANCRSELEKVLRRFGFAESLEEAGKSSSGRYVTYQTTVRIPSRPVLVELPLALNEVEGVKIVL